MMTEQQYHIKTEEGERVKKSDLFPYLESNYNIEDLYDVSVEYIFNEDDMYLGNRPVREFSWHFFLKWDKSNGIVKQYLNEV